MMAEARIAEMELFRRAICERDDEAWTTIMEQYRGIVLATIRRHSASHQLHEDDIYWINRAFQRFWAAVGPDRFGQFTELPAILSYLKMCAVSVLLDDLRALRRAQFAPIQETSPECAVEPDHGDLVSDRLDAAALWAAVLETLVSDTERLVARLSFVGGLSPREIFARHDDCFASVGDVYRVKRNLLERLRNKRGSNKHLATGRGRRQPRQTARREFPTAPGCANLSTQPIQPQQTRHPDPRADMRRTHDATHVEHDPALHRSPSK